MPIISDMIRDAREAAGLTQQAAAELLGVTQQQLSYWETGARQPAAQTFVDLMETLEKAVAPKRP